MTLRTAAWPGCRSPGAPGPRVPQEPRSQEPPRPETGRDWCGQNDMSQTCRGERQCPARLRASALTPSARGARWTLKKATEAWSPATPWAAVFEVSGLSLPLSQLSCRRSPALGVGTTWLAQASGTAHRAQGLRQAEGTTHGRCPPVWGQVARPRPPWCLLCSFPAAWGWLPALGVGSLGPGPRSCPSQTPAEVQMTLAESTASWLQSRGARDLVIWAASEGTSSKALPAWDPETQTPRWDRHPCQGGRLPADTYLQCWPLAGTRSTP